MPQNKYLLQLWFILWRNISYIVWIWASSRVQVLRRLTPVCRCRPAMCACACYWPAMPFLHSGWSLECWQSGGIVLDSIWCDWSHTTIIKEKIQCLEAHPPVFGEVIIYTPVLVSVFPYSFFISLKNSGGQHGVHSAKKVCLFSCIRLHLYTARQITQSYFDPAAMCLCGVQNIEPWLLGPLAKYLLIPHTPSSFLLRSLDC